MEQLTDKVTAIRASAKRLRLSCLMSTATEMLLQAQKESPSYDDFLLSVLNAEVKSREEKQQALRMKAARLPISHDLNQYDFSVPNGLSPTQLKQLRELHWVEEGYNLMLAGPCGVGKTYTAAGLLADAELAINLGEDIAVIQQKASLAIKEQHKRMQEQARRDNKKGGDVSFAELTEEVEKQLLDDYKINTISSMDKTLRSITESVWQTLSEEERIVLTKYTQTYSYLNETLRGLSYLGGRSKKEYDHDLPILTKALSKFTTPKNMIVRRGTGSFHIQELGKDLSQVQVGDVFTDKAFLSTAAHREKGFFRTFDLVITVPKGAQGVFAEPFSHYTDSNRFSYDGEIWDGQSKESIRSEFEWIGQRGSQFKVTKVSGRTIYLRMIGQLK